MKKQKEEADKKTAQDRQTKIWEAEAAQLKQDREKVEQERKDKAEQARLDTEKANKERLERERLVKEKEAAKVPPSVDEDATVEEPKSKRV